METATQRGTRRGREGVLTLPEGHLGLYVHVPFCVRKCAYCDFASAPPRDAGAVAGYLDAVAREADHARDGWQTPFSSVYFGGGTPTALGGDGLRRLWAATAARFPLADDAEITVEANPGTLTDDVWAALADLPFTRLSIGVQTLHDTELAALGRAHSAHDARAALQQALAATRWDVSVDLMCGIPGQTPATWEATLEEALAWGVGHVSTYALMLEEGTPLAESVSAGRVTPPDEDESEDMALRADALLAAAGYARYEVSNAARPGAHSRHNLGYWLGRDYLGLGPAATSARDGTRWRNAHDPAAYAARISSTGSAAVYVERLSATRRVAERAMLGLRLRSGFDFRAAERECAAPLTGWEPLVAEGLLEVEGDTMRLSDRGWRIGNSVSARLDGIPPPHNP